MLNPEAACIRVCIKRRPQAETGVGPLSRLVLQFAILCSVGALQLTSDVRQAGCSVPRQPMRLLRFVQLNPASTRKTYRTEEICGEFEHQDIVCLSGTCQRDQKNGSCRRIDRGSHEEFQWGYGSSPFVNKSCGISLLIRKSRLRNYKVEHVLKVPSDLRGRIGRVIIISEMRYALIDVYWPPKPQLKKDQKAYKQTCVLIFERLNAVSLKAKGALLFMGMDLNDCLDIQDPKLDYRAEDEGLIGDKEVKNEMNPGTLIKKLLEIKSFSPQHLFQHWKHFLVFARRVQF